MLAAMKPGWQTTEFWVTALTTAWALFGHALPVPVQAAVATVVPAAYSLARAIAKAAASHAAAATAIATATDRPPSPSVAAPFGGG